jgi:hypothetical protein
MNLLWWMSGKNKIILTQAKEAQGNLKRLGAEFKEEKRKKLLRQSDLWVIANFTTDEDSEYRQLAQDLTFLEQKLIRLSEVNTSLVLAMKKCEEQGSCEELSAMLPLSDPLSGLDLTIPKVEYRITRTDF